MMAITTTLVSGWCRSLHERGSSTSPTPFTLSASKAKLIRDGMPANEPKRNPCWFANLPQKLLLALELAPDRCPVIVIGVTRPDHFRRNITTLHLGKLM